MFDSNIKYFNLKKDNKENYFDLESKNCLTVPYDLPPAKYDADGKQVLTETNF